MLIINQVLLFISVGVGVVVHCCWCRVRMRFIEELFVVDKSVDDEFDEWFVLFDGDNGVDIILRLRRDETRVGILSVLGEFVVCWGDKRLLIDGRPRLPLTGDVGEIDESGGGSGAGGSQAEHCHDPSGMASKPAQ